MNKVDEFRNITTEMADLYAKKNANYGDSFGKLYSDLGPVSGLVPLHNKLDRLTNLIKGGKNNFESIEDTLIDLANYAIMNLIEIRANNEISIKIKPHQTIKNPDVAISIDPFNKASWTEAKMMDTNKEE